MAVSAQQQLAAIALSQGRTQAQAASSAGCGLLTLERWLTLPEFQQAVRQAQKEAYDQSISKLVAITGGAVAVLGSIAADTKISSSARVAACKFKIKEG